MTEPNRLRPKVDPHPAIGGRRCAGDSSCSVLSGGWVGEAMQGTDYQDLDKTPEATASTTKTMAANTAHLARQLKASSYPPA
ncbi:hypothetical protein ACFRDV_39350 [Streptomyces fagopyri]|uniref:hypothetical protein n=1 Tax=Streptomyces fagopyri TaxID=2662397 RepID=UPI0036AFD1B8